MRELLRGVLATGGKDRITPACAGITLWRVATAIPARDHPRVCGNYYRADAAFCTSVGSPPRVRELRAKRQHDRHSDRITPACAGITGWPSTRRCWRWDHPRVCGNYAASWTLWAWEAGSPPRVRELRQGNAGGIVAARITPACAGITTGQMRRFVPAWDHPRVCGNYQRHRHGGQHD